MFTAYSWIRLVEKVLIFPSIQRPYFRHFLTHGFAATVKPKKFTWVGAALLGPPPVPIFWYISHLDLEKSKERTFGTKRRRLEAELGQEHFCPRRSDSAGGSSLPEGEIIVIIITNNSPILGREISINIFNNAI